MSSVALFVLMRWTPGATPPENWLSRDATGLFFGVLIWATAIVLNRLDGRRAVAEKQVHQQVETLNTLRKDISEQKAVEARLRASEQRFRGLVENLGHVGILQLSPRAEVVYANDAALAICGQSRQDIIGKNSSELGWIALRPDGTEIPFEMRPGPQVIATGQAVRNRVIGWRRPASAEVVWTLAEMVPLFDAGGKQDGAVAAFTDITKQKQAEESLRAQGVQLRALTTRLQEIREEERTIVARDLHDQIGQAFTALKMDMAWLAKHLQANQADAKARIKGALDLLNEGAEWVRTICTQLRPGVLDDLGLGAAIEWQAKEFSARTGIPCDVRLPSVEPLLDASRSTACFRIFQEALTNIVRHAEARRVSARLQQDDGKVVLLVEDDGKGVRGTDLTKSLGVLGMQERAQACGGEVQISGEPGKGTKVSVVIPLV